MDRAKTLRKHADEYRRLAKGGGSVRMRRQLEELASLCEAIAHLAEGGAEETQRRHAERRTRDSR
jgi:hypothetical protein